jgi:hypothetical protein
MTTGREDAVATNSTEGNRMIRTMIVAALVIAAAQTPVSAQTARFESPKVPASEFTGVKLDWNAAFTQAFQSLNHTNTAGEVLDATGKNVNALADIGAGFNLAAANIGVEAEVGRGIDVVLDVYLSSRHHNETWVKGGYLQIDASPINHRILHKVMEYTTLKIGHMELNYGDAHFRRTDNGNAIDNPFVENLIMDAFTTEIGGEAYVRRGPFMVMGGVTSGQNKGDVTLPEGRSWAFLTKVGFDKQLTDALRTRLTVSTYQNDNAGRATLYAGDRAGSHYWGVMDNATAAAYTNGRYSPNFTEEINALQINPFVKFGPVEVFGVIEKAKGRTSAETEMREVTQYAVDGLVRLLDDRLYVAGRYNTLDGQIVRLDAEHQIDRAVVAAGWFVTKNVLLKGEYVTQKYDGWGANSILNGAKFDGFVMQGVVSF